MQRNNYCSIVVLFVLALIGNSCKTNQGLISNTKGVKTEQAELISLQSPSIKTANFSKISISLATQGKAYNFTASLKIIRDSIIQVAVQPMLGIEVARINLFPDSIQVVDRMNGKFFSSRYDSIRTKYRIAIDYQSIQALLLNELFVTGEQHQQFDSLLLRFSQSAFPDGYLLRSKNSLLANEFIVGLDKTINYTSITMPLAILSCRYAEFRVFDSLRFPTKYNFEVQQGPAQNIATITVQTAVFNTSIKINPTNLANFVQVDTFEQLIP